MVKTVNLENFIKVYRKSEVVVQENTQGDEMYLISSGKVRLTTMAPGREVELAMLGPGDFFGEMFKEIDDRHLSDLCQKTE